MGFHHYIKLKKKLWNAEIGFRNFGGMSKIILVSACLAGVNCRYDRRNNLRDGIHELVIKGKAIAVCPEVLGGLDIPRDRCEIITDNNGDKKIMNENREDFTKQFVKGARKTLKIAQTIRVENAILQSRSPSCGYGQIYDGTFTQTLKKGNGITAELFLKNGIEIYTERDFETLLKRLGITICHFRK